MALRAHKYSQTSKGKKTAIPSDKLCAIKRQTTLAYRPGCNRFQIYNAIKLPQQVAKPNYQPTLHHLQCA